MNSASLKLNLNNIKHTKFITGKLMDLKKYVRNIPDFPEKGIIFRDLTTLFNDAKAFGETIKQFEKNWKNEKIDSVAGVDARGFIIGGALAYRLELPFIPIRKKGKLPYHTISEDYDLEYGKGTLEIHKDSIGPGDSVLIVDDLIATGGTAVASINLLRSLGADIVGCGFVIDLPEVGGRSKLISLGVTVRSVMTFEGH